MEAATFLLIARVLTGAAFFMLGLINIGNHGPLTGLMRARSIPLPPISAAIGIGMQIVFGAMLATGLLPVIAALGLALFVVMATVIAHWPFMGTLEERKSNTLSCLSNAIMLGGLLALAGTALANPGG